MDNPDQVQVRAFESERAILFELRVHPSDRKKVIGPQGCVVNAMRTILAHVGVKLRKRLTLFIMEE